MYLIFFPQNYLQLFKSNQILIEGNKNQKIHLPLNIFNRVFLGVNKMRSQENLQTMRNVHGRRHAANIDLKSSNSSKALFNLTLNFLFFLNSSFHHKKLIWTIMSFFLFLGCLGRRNQLKLRRRPIKAKLKRKSKSRLQYVSLVPGLYPKQPKSPHLSRAPLKLNRSKQKESKMRLKKTGLKPVIVKTKQKGLMLMKCPSVIRSVRLPLKSSQHFVFIKSNKYRFQNSFIVSVIKFLLGKSTLDRNNFQFFEGSPENSSYNVEKVRRQLSNSRTKAPVYFNRVKKGFPFHGKVLSTRNFSSKLFSWRHLEINSRVYAGTLLPISNLYFYSFVLDNPYLWRYLLIEYHTYFKNFN